MKRQVAVKTAGRHVVVPIAAGFDEESVVHCVSQLRRRGIRVWLAGVGGRELRSQHGLSVRVDKQVRELGAPHAESLILLTGGSYSLHTVLNSAEMLAFLDSAGRAGSEIVTMGDCYDTVEEAGVMTAFSNLRWRVQTGETLPEFLSQVGVA